LILSTNQELGEYDLIKLPEHIQRVWEVVESKLPSYWDKFLARHADPSAVEQLAAKFGDTNPHPKGTAQAVASAFKASIEEYNKESEAYRRFFDLDALDEFKDDPNSFKHALSKDVPVIARTLQNRRPELREWQQFFRAARSRDLLQVFTNVVTFVEEEWSPHHPPSVYADYDAPDTFGLDPLEDDETMIVPKVIAMGIKSIVVYYLDPERLPARGRNGLYGMYFLSGGDSFGLPSRSSEFLMINDMRTASNGSMIMDQNYWYPYGLFSVYSLRLYRWIEAAAAAAGYVVDPKLRFVFTDAFLGSVCDQHTEDLSTMRAHDRFGVMG
jgi:hypothetical protein